MRARVVDWALFVFVTFEVLSGLGSFLVGRPEGSAIFVVHGVVGLSVIILLTSKLRRVSVRVTESRRWRPSTLVAVLAALLAISTVSVALIWTTAQRPLAYPNGMILHTTLALLLLVFYLWHMALRFKRPTARDLRDRRSALGLLGALVAGGALWGAQQAGNRALDTPGARRRFTGSRAVGAGGLFPATMWMFDNPSPLDMERWTLRLFGAVEKEVVLAVADIAQQRFETLEATLDCTGGWHTTQEWGGVGVGALLAQAGVRAGARYVRFHSVTGYRWSLPLAEAQEALLATHVAGQPLSHGYGAPLRLVAPGRRGFQWVKWVSAVEVTAQPDGGQWAAIFLSGLG